MSITNSSLSRPRTIALREALILAVAALVFSGFSISPSIALELGSAQNRRAVSLSPNLTDFLVELDALSNLVGTTEYSVLPPSYDHIPRVGDLSRWNMEVIVALKPDIIFVLESGPIKRPAEYLVSTGFDVSTYRMESVDEMLDSILRLGRETGREDRSKELHDRLRHSFLPSSPIHRKTALLLVATQPILASTPRSFEGDLLERAGFKNALPPMELRRPKLSPEILLSLDPDVLFMVYYGAEPPPLAAPFASLRAVREGKAYFVRPDELLRPGPLAVKGFEFIKGIAEP